MATNTAIEQTKEMTNGVDVGQTMEVISAIESDSGYAKFQWRATNQWVNGGLSRSRIKDFFAGNTEDTTCKHAFTLDSARPNPSYCLKAAILALPGATASTVYGI